MGEQFNILPLQKKRFEGGDVIFSQSESSILYAALSKFSAN